MNKQTKNYREKIMKFIRKVLPLIGLCIFIYLIYNIGINKIIDTFSQISIILIGLALFYHIPRVMLKTYQWQYLNKKQKIEVKSLTISKIFLIYLFYGAITPGYIGTIIKVAYMKEATNEPLGKLFINNVIFTILSQFSLYLLFLFGIIMISNRIPETLPISITFILIMLAFCFYFYKKERGEKTLYFIVKLLMLKKLKNLFNKFIETFYMDFPNFKELIVTFIIGIPCWIIVYTQIYTIALSFNINVPYLDFILFCAVCNVVALIPISIGGLGTREYTFIVLLEPYGVEASVALVISLAGYLITDISLGIVGIIVALFESRNKKNNKFKMKSFMKNIDF